MTQTVNPTEVFPTSKCFINLSNHPSSKWDEKQLNAANAIGEVIDVAFPNVNSQLDSAAVQDLAWQTILAAFDAAGIKRPYRDDQSVWHVSGIGDIYWMVQGEATLQTAIIILLMQMHMECGAATSERIVKEEENGKKLVEFHFVQFRDYPSVYIPF